MLTNSLMFQSNKLRRKLIKRKNLLHIHLDSIHGNFSYNIDDADVLKYYFPANTQKPVVAVVKDGDELTSYWRKFERFLINNDIEYDFLNIHETNFIDKARYFDLVLWHTMGSPAALAEAESKIWLLEKVLKKLCFPSFDELWSYENKIRQYYLLKCNNLPVVQTFVCHSYDEVSQFIETCEYPIVSKLTTSSGSKGVELIRNNRLARRFVDKVFRYGNFSHWTYQGQKDYVYFQKFIEDSATDIRIILVGPYCWGYVRHAPDGDFRASGAGNEDYEETIPRQAYELAKKVKSVFRNHRILAVDMLFDKTDMDYKIIETSVFYRIDFPSEMIVDGKQGLYHFTNNESSFIECKYWPQELVLSEIMDQWCTKQKKIR